MVFKPELYYGSLIKMFWGLFFFLKKHYWETWKQTLPKIYFKGAPHLFQVNNLELRISICGGLILVRHQAPTKPFYNSHPQLRTGERK